jgi:hypothetical protein
MAMNIPLSMFLKKSAAAGFSLPAVAFCAAIGYAGFRSEGDSIYPAKAAAMFFKILRYSICVLACAAWLPLAACGERQANPLIGEWVLNTAQMAEDAAARIRHAAPDSKDNIQRLAFTHQYVLLGTYNPPKPRRKNLTPQDPEFYEDTSDKNKPPQGRKIPATYQVHPAAEGKKPVVTVMMEDMPKREVTIYSYGDTEFIIWPVDGIEYRYERPKH